jgi:hypothetical protein
MDFVNHTPIAADVRGATLEGTPPQGSVARQGRRLRRGAALRCGLLLGSCLAGCAHHDLPSDWQSVGPGKWLVDCEPAGWAYMDHEGRLRLHRLDEPVAGPGVADLRTGALVPYGEGGWLYTSPPGLGEFPGLPSMKVSPGPGQPFVELAVSPAGAAVDGTDILIARRSCSSRYGPVESDLARITLDGDRQVLAGPWPGVCVHALGRDPQGRSWILADTEVPYVLDRRGYLFEIEPEGGLRFEAELPAWSFDEYYSNGEYTQLIVHEDSFYLSGWGLPVIRVERTQTDEGGGAFAVSHVVPRECRLKRPSKQYALRLRSQEQVLRDRSGPSAPLETTRALQRLGAEVHDDEVWLMSYARDHGRIVELLGELGPGGVIHLRWDGGDWLLGLPPRWHIVGPVSWGSELPERIERERPDLVLK